MKLFNLQSTVKEGDVHNKTTDNTNEEDYCDISLKSDYSPFSTDIQLSKVSTFDVKIFQELEEKLKFHLNEKNIDEVSLILK